MLLKLEKHWDFFKFFESALKIEAVKNGSNKKCVPKLIFFNEKKFRKIRTIFGVEN